MVMAQLKLKLRANKHTKTQLCLNSSLLSDPNITTDFSCSIHRTLHGQATDKGRPPRKVSSSQLTMSLDAYDPPRKALDVGKDTQHHRPHEAQLLGNVTEYRRLNHQHNVVIAEDREKFWEQKLNT